MLCLFGPSAHMYVTCVGLKGWLMSAIFLKFLQQVGIDLGVIMLRRAEGESVCV